MDKKKNTIEGYVKERSLIIILFFILFLIIVAISYHGGTSNAFINNFLI